MKITAHGRRRIMRDHLVADSEMKYLKTGDGKVKFSINSKSDPGISTGLFLLNFELEKHEADKIFEASNRILTEERIKKLEDEIRELKKRK